MESPRVWSRFTVTKKDGSIMKLRIQEVPKEREKEILEFISTAFTEGEHLQRAAGVTKSKKARNEMVTLYRELITKDPNLHAVMCCMDEDTAAPEVVAVSAMQLTTKNQEGKDLSFLKTKEVRKLFQILEDMDTLYDPIKERKLDKYYSGRGVMVHPDYREHGIATELVKARRDICKEHGVPLTGAWLTSLGLQKAAQKAGWVTVFEISYDELGQRHGVTFKDAPPSCKLMIAAPTE